MNLKIVPIIPLLLVLSAAIVVAEAPAANRETAEARKPASDDELRYWLVNMVVCHHFQVEEVVAATGLSADEVRAAMKRFRLQDVLQRHPGDPLLVLPYPGGRHPRLGSLDGAIRPQRETKVSIFTPWDSASYVVLDVPEAIWSNLGLTYLAHTHLPTLWSNQHIELPHLEWQRRDGGVLTSSRRLPNQIEFGVEVKPKPHAVEVELSLTNGTKQPLTGLKIQNCLLLGHAAGFETQISENKLNRSPYAACKSTDGKRWIIMAWNPLWRIWDNPQCPCMHSDPQLPDCPSGEKVRARGYIWFYEGTDIDGELVRLAKLTGWPVRSK